MHLRIETAILVERQHAKAVLPGIEFVGSPKVFVINGRAKLRVGTLRASRGSGQKSSRAALLR